MTVEMCEWKGTRALRLTTASLELIAVYAYGPRIASLRLLDGENILLWDADPTTHMLAMPGKGDWFLRGGHRVWVARPGADEAEDTYAPDNNEVSCEVHPDGFDLISDRCPILGIRRGFSVRIVDDDTLAFDNIIINDGPMLFSGAGWALTCSVPSSDCRYIVPLGDQSSWDTATIVHFNKWAGHGQGTFADSQFVVGDDAFHIDPQGRENKRMLQSAHGSIVMSDRKRGLTFGKRSEFDEQGRYPLNCNIAAYVGPKNFMVEMETMGPEYSLKPDMMIHHVETWRLRAGAIEATGAAARKFMD